MGYAADTAASSKDGMIYLAKIGDEVVGAITGTIREGEEVVDGRLLLVDKNYPTQQIGEKLIRHVQELPGCKEINISVTPFFTSHGTLRREVKESQLIKFYASLGFIQNEGFSNLMTWERDPHKTS